MFNSQYSRAIPTAAPNSSWVPSASNIGSDFEQRSPLYKLDVPASPVFVYTFDFFGLHTLLASGASWRGKVEKLQVGYKFKPYTIR